VRLKLSSRAWEVFRLTALEGWAAAAVAADLQMKIAQVYLVKSRPEPSALILGVISTLCGLAYGLTHRQRK
jgi:hypothetical protein